MKKILIYFAAACLGTVAHSSELPRMLTACPVFIEIGSSTGSGFWVGRSNAIYLVTAKHVLFDLQKGGEPLQIFGTNLVITMWPAQITNVSVLTVNIGAYHAKNGVRYSKDRDIAVALFLSRNPNGTVRTDHRFLTLSTTNISTCFDATEKVMRKFDEINPAEDVFTFGFPTSIGSTLPGRQQLNPKRPLAKKGIIADADPEKRLLVLDMPVYFGNSGGPVISRTSTGAFSSSIRVIGVVSQFVPFEDVWISRRYNLPNFTWSNSGYSIAEPIDHVLDLLWE